MHLPEINNFSRYGNLLESALRNNNKINRIMSSCKRARCSHQTVGKAHVRDIFSPQEINDEYSNKIELLDSFLSHNQHSKSIIPTIPNTPPKTQKSAKKGSSSFLAVGRRNKVRILSPPVGYYNPIMRTSHNPNYAYRKETKEQAVEKIRVVLPPKKDRPFITSAFTNKCDNKIVRNKSLDIAHGRQKYTHHYGSCECNTI